MRDLLAFPDSSRVWIYQADKKLPEDQIGDLNETVQNFAQQWTSHNRHLKATGGVLHNLFLVLVADESHAGASGCSIDASARFIKDLGAQQDVDFFGRMQFAYIADDRVQWVHRNALGQAYHDGNFDNTTLFFDNLVATKGDFLARWLVPFGESWMKRFV